MTPITDTAWLDPILPDSLSDSLLDKAGRIYTRSAQLSALLPRETAEQLARLLRVTNSHYSSLIEGHSIDPVLLEQQLQIEAIHRQGRKAWDLATEHVRLQRVLERALTMKRPAFADVFAPAFARRLHQRLWQYASATDLRLTGGRKLVPGQLRSQPSEEIHVGLHAAPAASTVEDMLSHLHVGIGRLKDARRRVIATLAYHHRFAWVHPFLDGNGRVARLLTHLQLLQLGIGSHLWSLARGLGRNHGEYYRVLSGADRQDTSSGQLSQQGYLRFIDFMLDTCIEQIQYMIDALDRARLRDRVFRAFQASDELGQRGVKQSSAPALLALLLLGSMPRAEFKSFLGLSDRMATDELGKLIDAGLVISPTPKSRTITPGLPVWFAQWIFPDLHRRFQ